MICPLCDNRSRVVESRPAEDGAAVRRRRECGSCGHRFTSFERVAPSIAIVRKRDGRRQEFDPDKVRAGLQRAAHKLPAAEAALEAIGRTIDLEAAAGGELSTQRIGELCLGGLREADTVAYLRFATVHKQLTDTEEIRAELRELDLDTAEPMLVELVGGDGWPTEAANHENFDADDVRAEPTDKQDLEANEPGREIHA
ncbi:MAG: transcriptional repressor NrdR [Thermoleophilia bacterium]|nr:transcriptional repressor NrdR [Thermoleophilia bacterium]